MKNRNFGFSLVELMVVIAIVSLLAAVAVPAYRDYTDRTKIKLAMNFLGELRKKSQEYYAIHGVYPTAQEAGYDATGELFNNPGDIYNFVNQIYLRTGLMPLGCTSNFRGLSSIRLDGTQISSVMGNANMHLQWTETPEGTFVTYCSDNSASYKDWVGDNCAYNADTVLAFFDAPC